jgi:hypothetical protein
VPDDETEKEERADDISGGNTPKPQNPKNIKIKY